MELNGISIALSYRGYFTNRRWFIISIIWSERAGKDWALNSKMDLRKKESIHQGLFCLRIVPPEGPSNMPVYFPLSPAQKNYKAQRCSLIKRLVRARESRPLPSWKGGMARNSTINIATTKRE